MLFAYFWQAWRQVGDFSGPDGLIDHRLCAGLFPPTRWSVFQPGTPAWVFRCVFAFACAASLAVVAGFHPRAAAALLFVIAASTYRWNALAAYLDDAMVHVLCLWLALLPVGETLALADWLAGERAVEAAAPGMAARAFMANMALVYFVAGLYKFASPMWRGGSAMHAALKMPVARSPDFWTLRHAGVLRAATWAALLLEPLFPLVFVLPAGSALKWFLAGCALVFHGGIAATLKIPYANAAMLAALPLAFGPEIMQGWLGMPGAPGGADQRAGGTAWGAGTRLAGIAGWALVAALAAMSAWEAVLTRTRLGKPWSGGRWGNPVRFLLWWAGVFQSYRLFDWVDERNFHVRYEVRRIVPGGAEPIDSRHLFPDGMRHLLLQSYLIGNVWMQMDPAALAAVRTSLLARHAQRYARRCRDACVVEAFAVVQRVTPDNLALARGERRFLMRFECRGGRAVVLRADGRTRDACAA